MNAKEIREETFYRGEYLGSFAESLVVRGYGRCRKGKEGDVFSFTHENLNELVVTVSESFGGHWIDHGYDVKLRGPRDQIREFMREAGRELERFEHSKEMIEKQMREVKEYSNILREVELAEARNSVGKPMLMAHLRRDSDDFVAVQIGNLIRSCDAVWLVGPYLDRASNRSWDKRLTHRVKDVDYLECGKKVDGALGNGHMTKYFLVDPMSSGEIIERIEDDRLVSIS